MLRESVRGESVVFCNDSLSRSYSTRGMFTLSLIREDPSFSTGMRRARSAVEGRGAMLGTTTVVGLVLHLSTKLPTHRSVSDVKLKVNEMN